MNNLIIDGDFWTIALWFMSYSFLGWLWESIYRSINTKKLTNSGFLAGPFVPIYGFGALLYILIMHFTLHPVLLFFIGGILACILEYITSWVLEKVFHARWWDYSKEFLNINGRVCLIGFLAFAGFAVVLPYIQLGVGGLINLLPYGWHIAVAIILLAIIIFDTIKTASGLFKFNETLARYQSELERHAAPLMNFVRKHKQIDKLYITKSKEKTREIITRQQLRIIATFPSFKSIKYPEAFKKIRKFYEDSRFRPEKVETKKKK
jgi:uncharacterized membrane protein